MRPAAGRVHRRQHRTSPGGLDEERGGLQTRVRHMQHRPRRPTPFASREARTAVICLALAQTAQDVSTSSDSAEIRSPVTGDLSATAWALHPQRSAVSVVRPDRGCDLGSRTLPHCTGRHQSNPRRNWIQGSGPTRRHSALRDVSHVQRTIPNAISSAAAEPGVGSVEDGRFEFPIWYLYTSGVGGWHRMPARGIANGAEVDARSPARNGSAVLGCVPPRTGSPSWVRPPPQCTSRSGRE